MHVGHMQCLGQLESRNEWKSNELWSKSNPAVLGLVIGCGPCAVRGSPEELAKHDGTESATHSHEDRPPDAGERGNCTKARKVFTLAAAYCRRTRQLNSWFRGCQGWLGTRVRESQMTCVCVR